MVLQVSCREGTSWRLVAHCPIHRCGRSKSTTASSQPTILLAHGRTSNSRLDIHGRRLPPTPATARWSLHIYLFPRPHRQTRYNITRRFLLSQSGGRGAQMVLQVPCRADTSWRPVPTARSTAAAVRNQQRLFAAHTPPGAQKDVELSACHPRLPPPPHSPTRVGFCTSTPPPHRTAKTRYNITRCFFPPPLGPQHRRIHDSPSPRSEVLLVAPIRSARVVIHQGVPRCRRPRHNRRGSRERSHKRSVSPLATTINHCLDGG